MTTEPEGQLTTYRHRGYGFTLPIPDAWWWRADIDESTALIVLEPDVGQTFRANIVVTVVDVPDGLTFDDWRELNDQTNERELDDYLLLDADQYDHHGRQQFYRLAHHSGPEGEAITIQQWSIMRYRQGFTLTASTDTLAFQQTIALFTHIADAFGVDDD